MMVLKFLLGFAPALAAWVGAGMVFAQSLGEENRRIIERLDERVLAVEREHDADLEAAKDLVAAHTRMVDNRLVQIERYLFWLMVSTAGVGTVVGADKASYWMKERKNSSPKEG